MSVYKKVCLVHMLFTVIPLQILAQQSPQLVGVLNVADYLSYTGFELNGSQTSPCTQGSYSGTGTFRSVTKSQNGSSVSASVDYETNGLTNAVPMTAKSTGSLYIFASVAVGTSVTLTGQRTGTTMVTSSGATVSASAPSGQNTASLPSGAATVSINQNLFPGSSGAFVTTATDVSASCPGYSYVTSIDLSTNLVVNNNCPGRTCGTAEAINSIAVSLSTAQSYSTTVLGDKPIIYYRLGEPAGATTAIDSSGNGHNGTYVGGVTLGEPGAFLSDPDTSATFDGSTGYLRSATDVFSASSTIEAWIFPTIPNGSSYAQELIAGTETSFQLVFGSASPGAGYIAAPQRAMVEIFTGPAYYQGTSTTVNLPLNSWTYLVGTWDNAAKELNIYVNGQLNASQTFGGLSSLEGDPGAPLTVGSFGRDGQWFKGGLDQVAYYNYALSAQQVLAHYSAALQSSPVSVTPVISTVSPDSVTAGASSLTLTLNGSGFASGAVVNWNGTSLTTTYVSATQLTASVPASLIASAGTAVITVTSGGVNSAGVSFTVNAGPTISNLSPSSATAGAGSFTLSVNGIGFASGAVVQWNGTSLTTTYVSATQLTASVPASLIASAGTATIIVVSGGVTSPGVLFTVTGPPIITSLNPGAATLGSAGLALTVNGSGFTSSSVVRWNGTVLPTTFGSAAQLSANVSSTLLTVAGAGVITVASGGAISNSFPFAVNPATPSSCPIAGTTTVSFDGYSLPLGTGIDATAFLASAGISLTAVTPGALHLISSSDATNPSGRSFFNEFNGTNPETITFTMCHPLSSFTFTRMGIGANHTSPPWNAYALDTNGNQLATVGEGFQYQSAAQTFTLAGAGISSVRIDANNLGCCTFSGPPLVDFSLVATSAVTSPIISGVSPSSGTAGGAAFTLTVNGSGFSAAAVVQWNGTSLTTTYASATQLTAFVPATLIASAGTANVTVSNPGTSLSNTVQFAIAALSITGLNPSSSSAGGPQFTLIIGGSGFAVGSMVLWNNSQVGSCTVLNATQITCVISAALVATPETARISVSNPGGVTSNVFNFNVGGLAITSLNPSAATAGGPGFPLAVNGSGFAAGSVVQWNGISLTTNYVSATQVVGQVTAAQISSAGTASIIVVNPGGSQSNSVQLPISPTALTISTSTVPAGILGSSFSQTLAATGGTPPYSNWRIASGALSSGLNLDATAGIISGTLSGNAGIFAFSVIVSDSAGAVSPAKTLSITINAPNSLTIVTPSALPTATVGAPVTQGFAASGGTPPYQNWAADTSGACPATYTCTLPPGTSLSALGGVLNAILSGTPTYAGTYQFGIRVTDSVNNSVTKQFTIAVTPTGTITISATGIVNSADYLGGSVAPGELITIFGSGMGPLALTGLQLDSNGNVAKSLAGVQVLFDGTAAPLIYVSSGQLSAVVPYEVAGRTSTKIQVQYQGQGSSVVTVPVASSAPGIYTVNASGTGGGAVINADGTINSPSNPAKAGSYISVFGTGEGQTNPPGVDGVLDSFPASTPAQLVTATIGSANATVLYAGGVPSLIAGVLQVNLQIPPGVSGNAVPLLINIGGATSQQGVTVAIQGSGGG